MVRTERDPIEGMVAAVDQKAIDDPLFLYRLPPLKSPTSLEPPKENPGWANIRRINWERRTKRLKKDWYGKAA